MAESRCSVQNLEDIRGWYAVHQVPDVGERPLREVVHPPFRIVYRLDETRIRIVRVA